MSRIHLLTLLVAAGLLLLGVACKGKSGRDEASIEKSLKEKGTLELMEEIGEAEYEPPADGRLTEEQIKMYIAVKKRGREIQQVAAKKLEEQTKKEEEGQKLGFLEAMKALGDVGDIVTADLRAAQELGYNPKEFQWVEEKVLEAQLAEMATHAQQAMAAGRDQLITMLEAQKGAVTDPDQRAELDRQIAELREEGGEEDVVDPAVEHNAALLGKFREEIAALQRSVE